MATHESNIDRSNIDGSETPPVVVVDVDQAEQILQLLAVCVDLLSTSAEARVGLAGSLSVVVLDQASDVDVFVDQLRFSRRYLDARLARQPSPIAAQEPIQVKVR